MRLARYLLAACTPFAPTAYIRSPPRPSEGPARLEQGGISGGRASLSAGDRSAVHPAPARVEADPVPELIERGHVPHREVGGKPFRKAAAARLDAERARRVRRHGGEQLFGRQ